MTTTRDLLGQLEQLPWSQQIAADLERASRERWIERVWERDASLWTGGDEANWLGWLDAPQRYRADLSEWNRLRTAAEAEGVRTVLLAGMGGSSLCPLVWQRTFRDAGPPHVRVIDSTVPAQVRQAIANVHWPSTWVVVSSKSGTTAETTALAALFEARLSDAVGPDQAASRMIAITDPGTPLAERATRQRFRAAFLGDPQVGGRFSAFTPFGLVPGVLHGAPVTELMDGAAQAQSAARSAEPEANPGLLLGIALGRAALQGADKLTLIASPEIETIGLWIEQLIAESTGKDGRGIVPVALEPIGPPDEYREDRFFVYVRDAEHPDAEQDDAIRTLRDAGAAVLTIDVRGPADLAACMYQWELATAVAGILLGVHPFNQPNVEATKRKTRELLAEYADRGVLPRPQWLKQGQDLRCFVPDADSPLGRALREANLAAALQAMLDAARSTRGYVAINAFIPETAEAAAEIRWMQRIIRSACGCPAPFGYGPRYLHSTGQLHKGGPPEGTFLFISAEDCEDVAVPGTNYSFGVLKEAQAYGDVLALAEVGRPVLWVNLGPDVHAGLVRLRIALEEAAGGQ